MITLDSKADQFVYDENYDYINNRDTKSNPEPIHVKKVHETFEVNTSNISGQFNKIFIDLIKAIADKAKEVNFKEEDFSAEDLDDAFETFKNDTVEFAQANLDAFANGAVAFIAPTGVIPPVMISPNSSGGPIPGKDYDVRPVEITAEPLDEGNENG